MKVLLVDFHTMTVVMEIGVGLVSENLSQDSVEFEQITRNHYVLSQYVENH
jgi:hypothetical protein